MAVWRWLVDTAGVLLLVILAYGLLLVLRRRWLSRRGGTFELSVRTGGSWALGLGRYDEDALEWFRIFSIWPRPRRRWRRGQLRMVAERLPEERESYSLYAGHVVARVQTPSGELEMAMSPPALTGLRSWLEAGPPRDPRAADP